MLHTAALQHMNHPFFVQYFLLLLLFGMRLKDEMEERIKYNLETVIQTPQGTVLRCVALCCAVLHCVALCCTVLELEHPKSVGEQLRYFIPLHHIYDPRALAPAGEGTTDQTML